MEVTGDLTGFIQKIIDLIERYLPLDQFIKFCVVGGIGTLLNLFILYIFAIRIGLWDIYALIIAFMVVVTFNYTLNKIWSFKNKERKPRKVAGQYALYILIGGTGMGINILSYILFRNIGFGILISEFFAILVATLWNFEGARVLVFRATKAQREKSASIIHNKEDIKES
jgi:putative flippase GtrA